MADPRLCLQNSGEDGLCLQARGPRKKGRIGHWGELPESLIETTGHSRSVLGNHLARTCLLIHADLCSLWTRPSSRKHEAAEDEGNRTSQHPCGISCGQDASTAGDNRCRSAFCLPPHTTTSLPPSAFSKTFLCGSRAAATASASASAEGVRQTTTQVLARGRACLRAACISFA